ncbi:phosphonate C-P lyase system protein PhnH [Rhodosalinus halophilus]|uniref:Phosphonate C-P lyase system protein PhnH n=1 Tax=Rhodosalinus halophilus TaxID=2259333 RepID=A0A365UAB3_9RHOB|nr:phosphonate C-P lyase system protein PhnH [Rhodosalinus halophilus]RBI85909.1 phosphonate C-P lyase system protein PhnH [Rhodosalinus halophilus]
MQAVSGGFQDAPEEAAVAFRAAMSALARPGRIERVAGAAPPAPLSVAAGVLLLTLCDADTPLHLAGGVDTEAVRAWVGFHTGAPLVGRGRAAFALGRWEALLPLDSYPCGTPEYPDRSATLIVEMERLAPEGMQLEGPGIEARAELGLPERAAFRQNHARFPLGLDFFFTCGERLAALPRSTRVL